MSLSSAGPRRMLILMTVATIVIGFVLCRQLWSLAAPIRRPQTKVKAIYLDDPHLIRENQEARSLRQQVDLARKKAFEHGSHACCISPPCSWCLLHLGQCKCALGVGSGRYACRECHGGWEADQGVIPGKTKDDVRKMKTISTDFMGKPSGPATRSENALPETQGRRR